MIRHFHQREDIRTQGENDPWWFRWLFYFIGMTIILVVSGISAWILHEPIEKSMVYVVAGWAVAVGYRSV